MDLTSLRERCQQLGTEIVEWSARRDEMEPDIPMATREGESLEYDARDSPEVAAAKAAIRNELHSERFRVVAQYTAREWDRLYNEKAHALCRDLADAGFPADGAVAGFAITGSTTNVLLMRKIGRYFLSVADRLRP